MHINDLDYPLPAELIAQEPPPSRDDARLLVMRRATGTLEHHGVSALPTLLAPSLLVVNDTRVFPARLLGRKPSGGRLELLLVERLGRTAGPLQGMGSHAATTERWLALGKGLQRVRPGTDLRLGPAGPTALTARLVCRRDGGLVEVDLSSPVGVDAAVDAVGHLPLPPYIRRGEAPAAEVHPGDDGDDDAERYQTVYARHRGAVAAPTAGLHLSTNLMASLESSGHDFARLTLHVGPGTFAPLRTEVLDEHPMHSEWYDIPAATAAAIRAARAAGRPVVAVGTTVVRALEARASEDPGPSPASAAVVAGSGRTDIFIYPPYRFRVVDALLTNFHLPRSTLLALVMAFAGREFVHAAYRAAIADRYRFFSYGDAMLII